MKNSRDARLNSSMLPYFHWKSYKGLQITRVCTLLLFETILIFLYYLTFCLLCYLIRQILFTLSCSFHYQPLTRGCLDCGKGTVPGLQVPLHHGLKKKPACAKEPTVAPWSRRPAELSQIVAFRDICATTGTELVLNLTLEEESNPLSCNFPKCWQPELPTGNNSWQLRAELSVFSI